jgi:hypothetical protein
MQICLTAPYGLALRHYLLMNMGKAHSASITAKLMLGSIHGFPKIPFYTDPSPKINNTRYHRSLGGSRALSQRPEDQPCAQNRPYPGKAAADPGDPGKVRHEKVQETNQTAGAQICQGSGKRQVRD